MKQNHESFKVGRIMIVDDEVELMTVLCEALAGQGYETTGFSTGADALNVLVEQDYDLLLTDLMMPEMDGIALLQSGLEIDPNLVGIIMTGQGTVQTAVEAMKTGAFDYVMKPFKLNTLLPLLSRAMEVRSLRMENIQLRETVAIHELGKVIAFSSDLNTILNKVADAALQQCTADEVSIMLPTRDGKELYVAVSRGWHREYIGERVPIERGIAGWVARHRESVIINGKVDDPRFSPVNPRNDIRAAVSMPMLAGGNLVGVLNVNVTRSHRHMTLGQLKALSILVSIISPILENTWLNIQIRQAEEKYRSIFENATEGIYQSTPEGQFITVNTAMATMLGYDSPEELMSAVTDIAGQLYVIPEERTKLLQMIEECGHVKTFEARFYRKDGRMIWVSINIRAVCDKEGEFLNYDGIAEDISERKLAERQQALTGKILETLNRPNEIANLIRDILLLLKEHTGIEAIGIRLREGEDFPYFETNGFPQHFLESENHLCARDNTGEIIRDSHGNPCLECMCGNILCGRTDPSLSFFTKGGSFWTNSTTELLASTSEVARQACTRNRCNSEGYESAALIPLRSGDEIIGLLQLNDSRRDSFSIKMIQFLEGIGATIGIAVARKRSAEALLIKTMLLEAQSETSIDGILAVDNEGHSILFNKRFGELWKISQHVLDTKDDAVMMGYILKQLKDPEEFSRRVQYLYEHHDEKSRDEVEFADGRYLDRYSAPLLSADGQYLGRIWFFRDITERKRAEEALRSKQMMLARTESIAHIGSWAWNIATDKVTWSDELFRIFQRDPREGAPSFAEHPAFYHPEDMARLRQAVEAAITDGTSYELELRAIRKDGEARVCVARGIPEMELGGRTVSLLGSFQDITERKRVEDVLRLTRNYLDNLIDHANAPIITWDTEHRITRFNHAFEHLTGYTSEEVSGQELFILFPETSCDESLNKIIHTSIGECWESMDLPIRRKDGVIRIVLWNSANIYANDGKTIIANIAQGQDITERQQAEKALKESEKNYRLLANNVNDVIFVLDMNLNYTYISPSVKILRGYEPQEVLIQKSIEKTLTPSSQELAMRTYSEIMDLEKSEHRDINMSRTLPLEMVRKDGTTVWTEVKFSFIRDEDQRPVGILGVTREITERKQAEDSLKETLDSLRKAVNTTIQVMVSAVETRDPYTAGHQIRVADLACAVAAEMGLPQDRIEGIRMAGSIHDIGKLSIPAEILSKPTKLSEIEFSLIKEHARKGYEILRNVESSWSLAEIVYQHHERMDGSGYPRNLKGEDIIMEARIMAVSDVVEAMASHRPYRPGLGIDAALEEIEKNRGTLYDEAVVDACLRLFREKGYRLPEGLT